MWKDDVRLEAPCRYCKYRHLGCYDHCFLYKEWKHQTAVLKEIARKDKQTREDIKSILFARKPRKR